MVNLNDDDALIHVHNPAMSSDFIPYQGFPTSEELIRFLQPLAADT